MRVVDNPDRPLVLLQLYLRAILALAVTIAGYAFLQ
jgi:hypothetical protein